MSNTNNFLYNNTIRRVDKSVGLNGQVSFMLYSKTNNQIQVTRNECLNNPFIIEKILYDFEDLFNQYRNMSDDIIINKTEDDGVCYSIDITYNKLVINIPESLSYDKLISEDVLNKLISIIKKILKKINEKTSYEAGEDPNSQGFIETLTNRELKLMVYTPYIGNSVFKELAETHNKEHGIAKKMQMTFSDIKED